MQNTFLRVYAVLVTLLIVLSVFLRGVVRLSGRPSHRVAAAYKSVISVFVRSVFVRHPLSCSSRPAWTIYVAFAVAGLETHDGPKSRRHPAPVIVVYLAALLAIITRSLVCCQTTSMPWLADHSLLRRESVASPCRTSTSCSAPRPLSDSRHRGISAALRKPPTLDMTSYMVLCDPKSRRRLNVQLIRSPPPISPVSPARLFLHSPMH